MLPVAEQPGAGLMMLLGRDRPLDPAACLELIRLVWSEVLSSGEVMMLCQFPSLAGTRPAG